MNGKSKCKILKQIRQKIADENDIAYVTSECQYQGECSGTCPKCEAEVRYLEKELEKRRRLGKAIAVAGIAAALMVGSSGCSLFIGPTGGVPMEYATDPTDPIDGDVVLPGAALPQPTDSTDPTDPTDTQPTDPTESGPTMGVPWEE